MDCLETTRIVIFVVESGSFSVASGTGRSLPDDWSKCGWARIPFETGLLTCSTR
jgi:hypothetical protein